MRLLSAAVRGALVVGTSLLAGGVLAQPVAPAKPTPAAAPQAPSVGDVVPAFETTAIDGAAQKLSFPKGQRTVLLFFLSSCHVCHQMIPEWNRAYERRPKQLRVLGVIMDQEPPGFWSTISIKFPVVRAPGREFLRSLNITRAPLTMRVVEGGKIEDVALGIVDPIRLGELFRP